jgi:predicted TIM-barrel fold metal-dependent hydrolase
MPQSLIVDCHAYVGSDAYSDFSQTADELIADMDACGIDVAVVAPLQDLPGPDREVHNRLAAARDRYPERLIPFARLAPRYRPDAIRALDFAMAPMIMARMIRQHPAVTFILGHLGSLAFVLDAIEVAKRYPNVYSDLGFGIRSLQSLNPQHLHLRCAPAQVQVFEIRNSKWG